MIETLPQRILFLSKIALCAAVLMLVSACGGQIYRTPKDGSTDSPTCLSCSASSPVTAPVNPYLNSSMIGQRWKFQNADKTCTTWIDVMNPPPSNYYPSGSIMLRFTKSGTAGNTPCYWGPGIDSAWIDFVLSPMPDGSFHSRGWVSHFPVSLPNWAPYTPYASQVQPPTPTSPMPYMIVPPPAISINDYLIYDTSYDRWDFNGDNFDSFISGPAMANVSFKTVFFADASGAYSDQYEGQCGHETWKFVQNVGLVRVAFPNDRNSSCVANPASTTINRI